MAASSALAEAGPADTERQRKRSIRQVVNQVAQRPGSAPTVCRGCCFHPTVLERYEHGVTLTQIRRRRMRRMSYRLSAKEPEEQAALAMLGADDGSAHRST